MSSTSPTTPAPRGVRPAPTQSLSPACQTSLASIHSVLGFLTNAHPLKAELDMVKLIQDCEHENRTLQEYSNHDESDIRYRIAFVRIEIQVSETTIEFMQEALLNQRLPVLQRHTFPAIYMEYELRKVAQTMHEIQAKVAFAGNCFPLDQKLHVVTALNGALRHLVGTRLDLILELHALLLDEAVKKAELQRVREVHELGVAMIAGHGTSQSST
ncbi:hypothetical protein CALVIDRAFT_565824 [Calocera viscosa TUFC12733]|uniref:Uncharacterized protein n=1 Tax=Calocera viscosa (strain TUFC12733) TaxID=1330018 RepID=A0A167K1V9_CALVF|nr:hypothetical protein CALVIDRAFT_565824 [Calocera viscosa TUFC12733]